MAKVSTAADSHIVTFKGRLLFRMFHTISALIVAILLVEPVLAQDRTASLEGRVTDADNRALLAEIRAYLRKTEDGFVRYKVECSAITRSDGMFTCPELIPGRYVIQALPIQSIRHSPKTTSDLTLPPSAYFPKSATVESAEVVTLAAHQSEWLGIVVPLVHVGSIEGSLIDKPLSVMFDLQSASDQIHIAIPARFAYDPTTGRFQGKDIPTGHYILTAKWISFDKPRQAALAFDIGRIPLTGLNMEREPTVDVSGQVEGINSELQLRLQNVDGSSPDLVTSSKKGNFQFEPVPLGKYVITVESPPAFYVVRMISHGKEIPGASIALLDEGKASLLLTLASPALNIFGAVESCEHPEKCYVIAVEENSGLIATATTDDYGKFSIGGLGPGDYRLWAWADTNAIAYRDPHVLSNLEKDSLEIRIENNGFSGPVRMHLIASQSHNF